MRKQSWGALALFMTLTLVSFGSSRRGNLIVTAKVSPRARITVLSRVKIQTAVAANPGTTVTVWTDSGNCAVPVAAKPVASVGITTVDFTSAEVNGKKKFCLQSSDGAVKDSATIPK